MCELLIDWRSETVSELWGEGQRSRGQTVWNENVWMCLKSVFPGFRLNPPLILMPSLSVRYCKRHESDLTSVDISFCYMMTWIWIRDFEFKIIWIWKSSHMTLYWIPFLKVPVGSSWMLDLSGWRHSQIWSRCVWNVKQIRLWVINTCFKEHGQITAPFKSISLYTYVNIYTVWKCLWQ